MSHRNLGGDCSDIVQRAFSELEGVCSAKVDLGRKTACIDFDPTELKVQDFNL